MALLESCQIRSFLHVTLGHHHYCLYHSIFDYFRTFNSSTLATVSWFKVPRRQNKHFLRASICRIISTYNTLTYSMFRWWGQKWRKMELYVLTGCACSCSCNHCWNKIRKSWFHFDSDASDDAWQLPADRADWQRRPSSLPLRTMIVDCDGQSVSWLRVKLRPGLSWLKTKLYRCFRANAISFVWLVHV